MREQDKNTKIYQHVNALAKLEKIHPHLMLIYLTIIGSSLIFLFMIASYTLSKPDNTFFINFQFPKSFSVSLVLLLISSFSMSKALPAYERGNIEVLKKALGITLVMGVAFTICQYIGWYELNQSGIYLTGEASGAYLYVISGMHALHLVFGIIFLSTTFFKVMGNAKDPVRMLIMETNPYQKIKLEMLIVYWHYLDVMWVFLFFYFLFSF
jgi:cytochrome c oxidase subunit III